MAKAIKTKVWRCVGMVNQDKLTKVKHTGAGGGGGLHHFPSEEALVKDESVTSFSH